MKKKAQLDGLSTARGLAAVAVVLHHACGHLVQGSTTELWQQSGWSAVPAVVVRGLLWFPDAFNHQAVLFFILVSGFCVHLSLANRWADGEASRLHIRRYYVKRVIRILPMLIGALILTGIADAVSARIIAGGTTPSLPASPQVEAVTAGDNLSAPQFAGTLVFAAPFWIKPYGSNWPLWVLGWLAWFYLLYPLYAEISRRTGGFGAMAVAGAVMVCSVLVRHLVGDYGLYPVLRTWWLWCLGAFCAELYVGRHNLPFWRKVPFIYVIPAFIATAVLARFVHHLPALVSYVVWAPVLCFLTLKLCTPPAWLEGVLSRRQLVSLGGMSFSLYVSHMPLMVLLAAGWCRWIGPLPEAPWLILGGTALLVFAAVLFHRAVELPVESIRSRLARPSPAPQT